MDDSMAIIDAQWCKTEAMQIEVTRKVPGLFLRRLKITDNNSGNVIFRTKNLSFINFRNRTVMVDASGLPLVSFCKKLLSRNGQWMVFRGESFDENDLIFTVEKTKMFQLRRKLNVFLASNTTRQVADYKIDGNYFTRSCKIHKVDSSHVVAQMIKEEKLVNKIFKRRSYSVSIDPNIDLAFIAVLFAVQHEYHLERKKKIFTFGLAGVISAISKACAS